MAAQELKALVALPVCTQLFLTLAVEDLMSLTGLLGHQACMWYTDMCAGRIPYKQKKKKSQRIRRLCNMTDDNSHVILGHIVLVRWSGPA